MRGRRAKEVQEHSGARAARYVWTLDSPMKIQRLELAGARRELEMGVAIDHGVSGGFHFTSPFRFIRANGEGAAGIRSGSERGMRRGCHRGFLSLPGTLLSSPGHGAARRRRQQRCSPRDRAEGEKEGDDRRGRLRGVAR